MLPVKDGIVTEIKIDRWVARFPGNAGIAASIVCQQIVVVGGIHSAQ